MLRVPALIFLCLAAMNRISCEELDMDDGDFGEALVATSPINPMEEVNGPTDAVIGGSPVSPHKYQFIVSLQQKNRQGEAHFCSGVLISAIHVLTTAVCMDGLNTHDVMVGIGLHNRKTNDSEHFFEVKFNHMHKDFDRTKVVNDIALLTLATAFTNRTALKAAIIKLPPNVQEVYNVSAPYRMAGWGRTSNDVREALPLFLQGASAQLMPAATCTARLPDDEPLKASQICIDPGRTSMCQGDSGSPLFRQRSSGAYELVGLASYQVGRNCQKKNGVNVLTKAAYYLPWVKKALAASRLALHEKPMQLTSSISVSTCENAVTNGIFCRSCTDGVRWSKKCRPNDDPSAELTKTYGWV
ncbi:putative Chymotrypsin-like elastase family member 2A [Hypsibius exemplaris]|uniref:Chymotrypsin-like elastase family member 2A n=1 Tax=Hypsibius exemplaris TaxID=2072580 RepID=A0A9X6RKR3_HYPEX|nr:putative Chymotrypsin-like elastase family member 2A [Hypsibius exemplaris]